MNARSSAPRFVRARIAPVFASRGLVRRLVVVTALAGLVAGGAVAVAARVEAQQTPTAAQVAARVQRFYDQVPAIRMRFFQTYFVKLHQRYERSGGLVTFKKPGKMFWRYDAPNRKVLVSDGARIQLFEPGAEGEPGQVVETAVADSELPQALSFLTGRGRLEEQYAFRLVDPRTQGFEVPGGQVLELRPRRVNPNYERLLLYVTNGSMVVRVLIIGHDGNRNRFDFSQIAVSGVNAPDADFNWRPPAGTRRVNPGR
jgi:outer membrane lipoprotein carrier protein